MKPIYIYNGPEPEKFEAIAVDQAIVYFTSNDAWLPLWERVCREFNRKDDVLLLDSDLFFLSAKPLSFLAGVQAYGLIGAFPRRGGFGPGFLWLRQGLLEKYTTDGFASVTFNGVFFDTLDKLTQGMVDNGEAAFTMNCSDLLHIGGISVAYRELNRFRQSILDIHNLHDESTLRYLATSLFKYRLLYERFALPDESFPLDAHQAVVNALESCGFPLPYDPSESLEKALVHLTIGDQVSRP